MGDSEFDLVTLIADLWRIPRPGPVKLFEAARFVALRDYCTERFGGGKAPFALSTALRSLGFPCQMPKGKEALVLTPEAAATALERAFLQTHVVRRHLCPLDLADDLPPMAFGAAKVAQFRADELSLLFDAQRIARHYSHFAFEADRFAQFHWLVIEEVLPVDPRAEARAIPWFFDLMGDFGAIDPHRRQFPEAVEAALFHLLLAPWEEWTTMADLDWRGFRAPWIFTLTDDLFVQPKRPQTPDSLSLEPLIIEDRWGDEIELERPTTYNLEDEAAIALAALPASAWSELEAARATSLFETPVEHFLVRGFLAEGIDEFMAHMTTIEAAFGLELDHRKPKGTPHRSLSATKRVAARLAAALQDASAAGDYQALFQLRSAFVHGRSGLSAIPSQQRNLARALARRAAVALLGLAAHPTRPREDVLADLLDAGVPLL